jgi:hypothetical protein
VQSRRQQQLEHADCRRGCFGDAGRSCAEPIFVLVLGRTAVASPCARHAQDVHLGSRQPDGHAHAHAHAHAQCIRFSPGGLQADSCPKRIRLAVRGSVQWRSVQLRRMPQRQLWYVHVSIYTIMTPCARGRNVLTIF